MKTSSWNPPAQGRSGVGTLCVLTRFLFEDDKGTQHELSLFSTLYAVICSLRGGFACTVEVVDGHQVFSYNGTRISQTEEFASALSGYEFYLLREQKFGYNVARREMGVLTESPEPPNSAVHTG